MPDDVVPLPAYLLGCGCQYAERGWHLTSCARAREYDEKPLSDHPEYELGRRFQAINWQYPLRLSASIDVVVEIDPLLYIEKHLDEYDSFQMDHTYEAWEKPMVFFSEKLMEDCDIGFSFGFPSYMSRASNHVDEVTESPRWTPEMTASLDAVLAAKRVNPNQGNLLVSDE